MNPRRVAITGLGLVSPFGGDLADFFARLLAGETVMLLLERLSNEASRSGNFDQLVIPFRAVATDINTGEAAVLRSGNLAIAMRASMSIRSVSGCCDSAGQ